MLMLFCHVTVCTTHSSHTSQLCKTDIPSLFLQIVVFVIFCGYLTVNLSHLFHFKETHKKDTKQQKWKSITTFLVCGTILHTLSLLSSSFVEEEHQTWYFYTVFVHLLIFGYKLIPFLSQKIKISEIERKRNQSYSTVNNVTDFISSDPDELKFCELRRELSLKNGKEASTTFETSDVGGKGLQCKGDNSGLRPVGKGRQLLAVIVILVLCRLLRIWNQTGNKWLDLRDVGDWLVRLV